MSKLLRSFLILTLLFFATGCDGTQSRVEDDVFVELMVELHLVDMRRVSDSERNTLRNRVLAKYSVTNDQLVDTMQYYAHNSEAYAEVYTRIVDRLREESNSEL